MSESFLQAITRYTTSGELDFSREVAFINRVEEHKRKSRPNYHVAGWQKTSGYSEGHGTLPRIMRDPIDGSLFVFPILDVDREGTLAKISVVNPRCTSCGGDMERRVKTDGTEFFGCKSYPACTGSCDAWPEIKRGLPAQVTDETDAALPLTDADMDRLVERVTAIVALARVATEKHGMGLPIGYRTTRHLMELALEWGDADEAWKLWINGRINKHDRAKLDAEGLPAGEPRMAEETADGNPGWYAVAERALNNGLPVFLVGGAGSGKGRFVSWYSERSGKRARTIVGSGDVAGREMWVARRDASGGTTSTVPGPAALAAENGDLLFLDECDAFDPNSLMPTNAILNGDERVSVPVLGEIEINPDMRIIAAANTNGRSKDRTYNARNRLDGAFLNRFAVVLRTAYVSKVDRKVAAEVIAARAARLAAATSKPRKKAKTSAE